MIGDSNSQTWEALYPRLKGIVVTPAPACPESQSEVSIVRDYIKVSKPQILHMFRMYSVSSNQADFSQ